MIEKPNALVVLARGFAKRCGRCGQDRLFSGWFKMAERCPRCALPFERGEGYWLGAMAVNLGAAELAFGLTLLIGAVLTWPDPPWIALTVAGLAVNAVMPFLFYPFSKTIFVALDLLLLHVGERAWRTDHEPMPMSSHVRRRAP
ncbi:MAG: DUF983 domain-containing protein [Actinomycetota bacterium]